MHEQNDFISQEGKDFKEQFNENRATDRMQKKINRLLNKKERKKPGFSKEMQEKIKQRAREMEFSFRQSKGDE